MGMRNRLLGSLFLLLALVSCNSDQKKLQVEIDKLNAEILKTHDEVMPKIGLVLSLRRQIYTKIDSCRDEQWKDSLQKISYALTVADAGMMDWMHQYQTPASNDSALKYLEGQKKVIYGVKDKILNSISNAEIILKKYQNEEPAQ